MKDLYIFSRKNYSIYKFPPNTDINLYVCAFANDEKYLFHALRIKMCMCVHFNLQRMKYIFYDSIYRRVKKNCAKEIYNSYNSTT